MRNAGNSQEPIVEKPSAPLALALRVATSATLIAALLGTVGGPRAELAGNAAIAIVVASPLARVLFLAMRWFRTGDRRFSLAAVALLAVVLSGVALAALAR